MLMLNIGSKYISSWINESQEAYLTTSLADNLLIFSVAFKQMDIITSKILTVIDLDSLLKIYLMKKNISMFMTKSEKNKKGD